MALNRAFGMRRVSPLLVAALVLVSAVSCKKNADDHAAAQEANPSAPSSMNQHVMQPGAPNTGEMMHDVRSTCPMTIEGAHVEVSDTDDGISLTFTTQAGDVSELQRRVRHMAHMYHMHRLSGRMMWHHVGAQGSDAGQGRGMHRMPHGAMPRANTKTEKIANGARIVLTPTDRTQLNALREHVRSHQEHMSFGDCWMMRPRTPAAPQ